MHGTVDSTPAQLGDITLAKLTLRQVGDLDAAGFFERLADNIERLGQARSGSLPKPERQRVAKNLAAQGLASPAIAALLGVSDSTIRYDLRGRDWRNEPWRKARRERLAKGVRTDQVA